MPFITVRTNQEIKQDQEEKIKAGLGKAITFVPGKSEASLMVMFEKKAPIYLRGDGKRPMAFLDVAVFGNESHQGYQEFSLFVTKLINKIYRLTREISLLIIAIFLLLGWAVMSLKGKRKFQNERTSNN